jgi:GT2 family glycosyltransferase
LVEHCLGPLGAKFPVTVVDNSSSPQTRQIAQRHGARYFDPGRNVGFAAGVNTALAHASADSDVLLLNPEAVMTAADIAALQRHLHADPALACVAPLQRDPLTGAAARVAWPFPSPAGAWIEALGLGRLRRSADFVIGSVLLLRGRALNQLGGFEERFFLYAEETDWQSGATRAGWRCGLVPPVTATHVGASTGGDPTRREVNLHASQELFVRKHHGWLGWQSYRAAVIVGAAARGVVLPGPRGGKHAPDSTSTWVGRRIAGTCCRRLSEPGTARRARHLHECLRRGGTVRSDAVARVGAQRRRRGRRRRSRCA